jgi:hypothetical protein
VSKHCIHLQAKPDTDGVVRVRKNWAYSCGFTVPAYAMPVSVTRQYDFKWPPLKASILIEHCAVCPCFTAKAEPSKGELL